MRILTPVKGQAPIPDPLPGRFFVLEYDRESQSYTLFVDDEERSSYDLGLEIADIQAYFHARLNDKQKPKYPKRQIDDWIDYARGFGAAQYIPRDGEHVPDTVLQLPPRRANQHTAWSWEELEKEGSHAWRPDI